MKTLFSSRITFFSALKHALPVLSVGAVCLAPSIASAKQDYYDAIKDFAGVDNNVKCAVCHASEAGGDARDKDFFNVTLKEKGFTGGGVANVPDLEDALADLGDADTDEDEATDEEELKAGTDPSDPEDTPDGGGGSGGGDSGSGGSDSGSGGSDSGSGGSGGSGDDDDDDNPGASGQATSAGCSYNSLDPSTNLGRVAALMSAVGLAASMMRRRKRQ
jgi:hypothetical protein